MAWELAIIVDPHYDHTGMSSLENDMPIWIVDSPENQHFAKTMREAAKEIWLPEPICTTFRVSDLNAREMNCLGILNAVSEHHPNMTKLHFVGVRDSAQLSSGAKELGFVPFGTIVGERSTYVRSITSLVNVPKLQLDASNWKTADDIYQALFTALGAPAWHGRNFDALNDSIVNGSINAVEVPYTINIEGMRSASHEVQHFVSDLVDFISDREAKGCPVSIRIENN